MYLSVCLCLCLSLSLYIYIFSGEYHMYQFIPLHSCDYLKKISIKIYMATDEGNSRNEIRH